jgi:hypothetical protein
MPQGNLRAASISQPFSPYSGESLAGIQGPIQEVQFSMRIVVSVDGS